MNRILLPAACAAALLLSGTALDAVLAPAHAQYDQVDFDTFHDALAPYGDWVYSDRWGEVWIPTAVADDFQPYASDGYWAYTDDYGWTWVSDYDWGDIPFHYGRWVNDPDFGWLWIPGYVWSPAWVVWRANGDYVGWMPMPPDRDFLEGTGPSFGVSVGPLSIDVGNMDDDYGYRNWYGRDYDQDRFYSSWVFVGAGHMADRDFGRWRAPRSDYARIIRSTSDATRYSVVNHYVVNRGIDPKVVQRASGRPVQAMRLDQLVKHPRYVTTTDQGRQLQLRMRQEMPRGTGAANSAPKPPPRVIQSLSTKVSPKLGHAPGHLFTRDTIVNAPLPTKPGFSGPATPGPTGPGHIPGLAPTNPVMPQPGTQMPTPETMRHHGTMTTPGTTPATPTTPVTPMEHMEHRAPVTAPATTPTTPVTPMEHMEHRGSVTPQGTMPTAPSTPAAPPPAQTHQPNPMPERVVHPVTPPAVEHAPPPTTPANPAPKEKDKPDSGHPQP